MTEQPEQFKFSEFLKGLFQRSFELEMLVSGIAILLLLRAPESLDALGDLAIQNSVGRDFFAIAGVALHRLIKGIVYIVILNLVFHLILRCFWVSLVGLKSVYPSEIAIEKISPRPMLQTFMRRHLLSVESLAERVDKTCRVLFAFTFVVAFCFLSITVSVMLGVYVLLQLGYVSIGDNSLVIFLLFFFAPLLFVMLLDFASLKLSALSTLKDAAFVTRIAMFVYWIYGLPTLSFLYRSVYYSFLTNIRKVVFFPLLFLYVFVWIVLTSDSNKDNFDFFPDWRGDYSVSYFCYESLRPTGKLFRSPFIQSEIISEPYVKLVLSYFPADNDSILSRAPSLSTMNRYNPSLEEVKLAVSAIQSVYKISLNDSLLTDLSFSLYMNPKTDHPSIVSFIPVAHLPKGKQVLVVERTTAKMTWFIPFYL
ncbi:MAG: hypothetical protein SNJ55_01000 [Chloroherpetonaceae bacterium]